MFSSTNTLFGKHTEIKHFLLCSSTRLCKTPSPTQLFSSIGNALLGKLLKNYGRDLPTPCCSWMWCSGHPLHLHIDSSAEKRPRGWRLQILGPPAPLPFGHPVTPLQLLPARGYGCCRHGSLLYITCLPGASLHSTLTPTGEGRSERDREENLPSNC